MRRAKTEKTQGDFDGYMSTVKKSLAKLLTEGGTFVINIDESSVVYESLYDPDLKEFYSSSCFPTQIMNLTQLAIKEVYQRVTAGTQYGGKAISPDFKVRSVSPHLTAVIGASLEQAQDPTEQRSQRNQGQDREEVRDSPPDHGYGHPHSE